ncbi:hypothetical protein BJX66DRAFT_340318 [Aspergillus keveii]|uniref:Uncharacterized protein n=1 Tax=Aspergillus keveii TaxID=714993 RepID=A0ABR4FYR2_9EURO
MDSSDRVPVPAEDLLPPFAPRNATRVELPPLNYATLPEPPMAHGSRFQAYVEEGDEPPAYEEYSRNTMGEPRARNEAFTAPFDPRLSQGMSIPPGFQVREIHPSAQAGYGNIDETPSIEPNDSQRPASRASTVSTEPFPDFDAVEVRPPSLVYRCQEKAYEYALAKLAEDLVNARGTPTAAAGLSGPNFSTDQERLPNGPSLIAIQGVSPCSELSHHDHFCHVHEKQKLRMREKIHCTLLYSEDIPMHFRRRFTALTNMVIDMEFIFFRANHFPREPLRFVTQESLEKVRYYGTEMLRYLSRLGTTLNQSKITALSSQCLVSQVAARTDITALGRFQKMAEIARTFEQEFFELFSKFYDAFFFDDFHIMYNNYLVKKPETERVPPILVDVSYHLNSVYKILNRLVEDYRILKETHIEIGEKYLQPVLEELSQGPGVWEQCVRAANPNSFRQSGLQPTPIIHYTGPHPMQHLISGHEPQPQSAYTTFTERHPSPARIVDSPGTQRRMAQMSHIGHRGPVRIVDSPDTQRRIAQLSYTNDRRGSVNIVDSPGTQRRLTQISYTEGLHGPVRVIGPRPQPPSVQASYNEGRRNPGHMVGSSETQHHQSRAAQEQAHSLHGQAYNVQEPPAYFPNSSFTEGRQSQSPIIGEIIDIYDNRAPITQGYRLQSQIVDLNPPQSQSQTHQAQIERPQAHAQIHHPQPRRLHPFDFMQANDAQRTVVSHRAHQFAHSGGFGVQSPPPVYVEQVCPSEARYIHSMVEIIRGERPHSPGRWGRARVMSHTPEFQEHGLPYHGPFIRAQRAQPYHYNPGDHLHCHRPHTHIADNGRGHLHPNV